jgi:hypothetical protein
LSRERETGDGRPATSAACSIICVLFLSCATVTTQRMGDGRTSSQQHTRRRTSSQQHTRPSQCVSALTSISCAPFPRGTNHWDRRTEDRLPYIALIIAWFWLVLCHCQGSSNVKWLLLLCKFIGVFQCEIVFTPQDYQGVRTYGTYHSTRAERKKT